jgi:glutamate carboxypeptidase
MVDRRWFDSPAMSESEIRRWVKDSGAALAARAERELEALVAVSSPSGDAAGAEEAVAVAAALLPAEARIERPPCSSPDHAPDLLARMGGDGSRRLLLLCHLDTVVPHSAHLPLRREGERLIGSGAIDMKAGVAVALGVMRALAGVPEAFAELALLAVVDEEWRVGDFAHGERFAGFDACLCFEAGATGSDGEAAVIVKRKAAATVKVASTGVASHSGSAPEQGRSALLPLAAAAQRIAALHDPDGPERLSAVPTVMHCGEAFNVVPASGELICDLRADRLEAFEPVLEAAREDGDGVSVRAEIVRRWPGMDTREIAAPLLARASDLLGEPIIGSQRGGASDASHVSAHVPLTIDGLGPVGGRAHSPDEFVLAGSLRPRAEVALAMGAAALGLGSPVAAN